jgi:hypothetical protein
MLIPPYSFYLKHHVAAMAPGSASNTVITTGEFPVFTKGHQLTTNGANVSIQIFENPTGISGGTPATPISNDRVSPKLSIVGIVYGATVANAGTSLGDPQYVWQSAKGNTGSTLGFDLASDFMILKSNTQYLIQIKNNDTATADFDHAMSWQEAAS